MGTAALTRLAHLLLHDPLLDDLNRQAPESPFAFRKSYLRMETRKRGVVVSQSFSTLSPYLQGSTAGFPCRSVGRLRVCINFFIKQGEI